jgi:hypothetical protein
MAKGGSTAAALGLDSQEVAGEYRRAVADADRHARRSWSFGISAKSTPGHADP